MESGKRLFYTIWMEAPVDQARARVALICATTRSHTVVCALDMEQAIAYVRVSMQRQHRSGLGIEAQRSAGLLLQHPSRLQPSMWKPKPGKGPTPWTGALN